MTATDRAAGGVRPTYRSPGRGATDQVEGDRVPRFDRTERWLHWVNATLLLILVATGSVMYVDFLTAIVGRRILVETIHLYAGLALPFPFLAVVIVRWGRVFRRDARRLGRFTPHDQAWLRAGKRRQTDDSIRLGKFNPGQKLNAILVAGALPVMLATGSLMKWHDPFSDSWRTGATFVHDLGYVGLTLLIAGHIHFARKDPQPMLAMRRGWPVPLAWAREHHPRWHP